MYFKFFFKQRIGSRFDFDNLFQTRRQDRPCRDDVKKSTALYTGIEKSVNHQPAVFNNRSISN